MTEFVTFMSLIMREISDRETKAKSGIQKIIATYIKEEAYAAAEAHIPCEEALRELQERVNKAADKATEDELKALRTPAQLRALVNKYSPKKKRGISIQCEIHYSPILMLDVDPKATDVEGFEMAVKSWITTKSTVIQASLQHLRDAKKEELLKLQCEDDVERFITVRSLKPIITGGPISKEDLKASFENIHSCCDESCESSV